MIHTLTKEFMGSVILGEESLPLHPIHTLVVPALCVGRIVHGMDLLSSGSDPSWVCLVPEPETLIRHGLLVESGPVDDGIVVTTVFNLTNTEKRLTKRDCISRLIKIPGAKWSSL